VKTGLAFLNDAEKSCNPLHLLFSFQIQVIITMKTETKEFLNYNVFKQAADYIESKTQHQPGIGLILGSGLSPLAEDVEAADYIPYEEIPGFPVSNVPGHAGRLVIGRLAGKTVLVMQGRTHFYEGYSMQQITLPVRVMQVMGIKTLVVTNAAGGINPRFKAGDLMLIVDHINMIGMSGSTPLRGPNFDMLGPRFPSMTQAYSLKLTGLARRVARRLNIHLQEGCIPAWPALRLKPRRRSVFLK
jgi:purine-nucleoside phosphorylase